jgi:hypothetical protein
MADLQKLIVLAAALVAFLCAAQAGGGMNWRSQDPLVTIAAR